MEPSADTLVANTTPEPTSKPKRVPPSRRGKGPTPSSWRSGVSGNPAGRPRGFAGVAAQIMAETGDGGELVRFALEVFRDEKRPYAERRDAHAWLSDRGLGRPVANVELTVAAGDNVQRDWSAMPLEERRELLAKLRAVPAISAGSEGGER